MSQSDYAKAAATPADGLQIRFLADPKPGYPEGTNNHGHETGSVAIVSKPRALDYINKGVAELAQ